MREDHRGAVAAYRGPAGILSLCWRKVRSRPGTEESRAGRPAPRPFHGRTTIRQLHSVSRLATATIAISERLTVSLGRLERILPLTKAVHELCASFWCLCDCSVPLSEERARLRVRC